MLVIAALLLTALPVYAHASLSRSEPASNAVLEESPSEIRLWFTEPLEPSFSRIRLRDTSGSVIETEASQIDNNDPMQMFVPVSNLPDGVYTVVWQVVSTADGHLTSGNFAFTVGEAVTGSSAAIQTTVVSQESTLIRWFYLLSLSLAIGSMAFWLFVWQPSMPEKPTQVEPRLYWLMCAGWVLLGISSVLMLMLHVSGLTGTSLWGALFDPALALAFETRYGQLWLARAALWVMLGVALYAGRKDALFLWIGLMIGTLITAGHSFASHASAAPDRTAAVFVDVLHTFATALWLGGLVQFANALLWAKQRADSSTQLVAKFVQHFSNYARVAVAVLVVTGSYSAWLQVGSVTALLTTQYGHTLLLKLILFAPLLLIAAVNLVFTARGLARGDTIWVGRLRSLIGAEIALMVGILVTVGALTSINPGRAELAGQEASILEPDTAVTMQITDELHAHMEITPGWVGENRFQLGLYDIQNTEAVNDATSIRLRFENLTQNLGTSELRPTFVGDGVYVATGANLSVPGRWRIRMTLQRPDRFDTVLDFTVTVAPEPPARPLDMTIPPIERVLALVIAGAFCLAIGGAALIQTRLRLLNGAGILGIGALALGVLLLVSGVQLMG